MISVYWAVGELTALRVESVAYRRGYSSEGWLRLRLGGGDLTIEFGLHMERAAIAAPSRTDAIRFVAELARKWGVAIALDHSGPPPTGLVVDCVGGLPANHPTLGPTERYQLPLGQEVSVELWQEPAARWLRLENPQPSAATVVETLAKWLVPAHRSDTPDVPVAVAAELVPGDPATYAWNRDGSLWGEDPDPAHSRLVRWPAGEPLPRPHIDLPEDDSVVEIAPAPDGREMAVLLRSAL